MGSGVSPHVWSPADRSTGDAAFRPWAGSGGRLAKLEFFRVGKLAGIVERTRSTKELLRALGDAAAAGGPQRIINVVKLSTVSTG
jgi:hypothetical protein